MLNKDYNYAIIGASNDESKYGYKVLKNLKDRGFKVYPVNPKAEEILGLKVYKNIAEIKEKIDVAVFIIPPQIGIKIIPEIKEANIKNVWFQPGAESLELIEFCKKNNLNYTQKACVMMN